MVGTHFPEPVAEPYRVAEDLRPHLPLPECTVTEQVGTSDDVLLIRLGGIGDALRILPVAAYLRNNGFEGALHCAVEPPVDDLLRFSPYFDRVHGIPLKRWMDRPIGLFDAVDSVRAQPFDWVFDCHGILKSGVLAALTSTGRRIGYHPRNSKEFNERFQDALISELDPELPRLLKYVQLLRPFTAAHRLRKDDLRPELSRFGAIRSDVRDVANREPILLHPSTSRGRYGSRKDWGIDRFRGLLDRLEPDLSVPVYVTWGPSERRAAEQLAGSFGPGVRPAPRTSPIRNLAHLIRRGRMVITVDSSPAHVADMVGTPVMVVYEVGKERINAPFFSPCRIATPDDDGSPGRISVDRVAETCRELLEIVESDRMNVRTTEDHERG